MTRRFWVSWYEKEMDYRPLSDPPNEQILGWWNTGMRCSDDAVTICAMVRASDEDDAWRAVLKDWPQRDGFEKRFCEERFPGMGGYKLSDRFPLNAWMRERIEQEGR